MKTNELVAIEEVQLSESSPGNYAPIRYNALKHGVLTKLVVLPHEDGDAYETLLADLIAEHSPAGPTEMHLVEELAGIMWRKRRVLLAEGAEINKELCSVVRNEYTRNAQAAAPFEPGMPDKPSDPYDLMAATQEQILKTQQETRRDREHTERAAVILRRGGPSAYAKALKALLPENRDWWEENVEEKEYEPTAEGLTEFIQGHLLPICISMEKEAIHHDAIKAQTLGDGFPVHVMDKLSRYEVHLDRKLERTLAMLIKLKELRTPSESA